MSDAKPEQVLRVNLTSPDFKSTAIAVPEGVTRMSLDLISDSAKAQGTAVVEIRWSLSTDTDPEDGRSLANFRAFADVIELTGTKPFAIDRALSGIRWIRAQTKTPLSTADESAKLVLLLY